MAFVKETRVWMVLENCRNRYFTHNFLLSKPCTGHVRAKRESFVSPRPNAQADSCKACALELKPRAEKKMADVLDVDVEDKGGFSEDEGDGKN